MKYLSRLLWFLAGGVTFAIGSFCFSLYRDMVNADVTINVANSFDRPVQVQVAGYRQTFDLGTIGADGTIQQHFTLNQIGEGPAWLIVDGTAHAEYRLGVLLTGKGNFERYIRLTPKGAVAFFYAPAKGSWCGFLNQEGTSGDTSDGARPATAPTQSDGFVQ